jgi:hypothetical protein
VIKRKEKSKKDLNSDCFENTRKFEDAFRKYSRRTSM